MLSAAVGVRRAFDQGNLLPTYIVRQTLVLTCLISCRAGLAASSIMCGVTGFVMLLISPVRYCSVLDLYQNMCTAGNVLSIVR